MNFSDFLKTSLPGQAKVTHKQNAIEQNFTSMGPMNSWLLDLLALALCILCIWEAIEREQGRISQFISLTFLFSVVCTSLESQRSRNYFDSSTIQIRILSKELIFFIGLQLKLKYYICTMNRTKYFTCKFSCLVIKSIRKIGRNKKHPTPPHPPPPKKEKGKTNHLQNK